MVAGPNGSGKTTLYEYLGRQNFKLGFYINADDIQKELFTEAKLDFSRFNINVTENELYDFFKQHPLCPAGFENKTSVVLNVLHVNDHIIRGYFAAILADFIRQQLVRTKQSFTFETVMSSDDKIILLKTARETGYKAYLYYICTDSVVINKDRVAGRVLLGGHDVPEEKIEPRYERSLELLLDAIRQTHRAYLFDNSGAEHILIAEVTDGKEIELKVEEIPAWFIKYVYNKISRQ